MMYILKLRAELDNNPSLYNGMTDQEVVDELNRLQFSVSDDLSGMMLYLLENGNRSNTGTDLTQTSILGRLHHVAESIVGDDPFGSNTPVTLRGKHAAQAFLDLLTSPHLTSVDFTSVSLDFTSLRDMEIMRAADVSVLVALSQNKASRAMQIGLGIIRIGNVTLSRAQ